MCGETHLRNRETAKCPFAGCSFQSDVQHSHYHKFATLNNLRPELFVPHTLEEDSFSDTEVSPSCDSMPEAEHSHENGEAINISLVSLLLNRLSMC